MSDTNSQQGAEKRAFTRNAISLDGVCGLPGERACGITILDFCLGGVYLSFSHHGRLEPPCAFACDDLIEIRCSVAIPSGEVPPLFRGRVVRITAAGAGIAFITPSFDALEVLHEYAKTNPGLQDGAALPAERAAATGIPRMGGAKVQALLGACRDIAEDRVGRMAKTFLEQAKEHLFKAAGEVRGIAEKNARYTALSIYNRDGETFKNEFLSRMRERLVPDPAKMVRAPNPPSAGVHDSEAPLALVEENSFEDWLAFTDMARAAELEHRESLAALELRLGALFRMTVNKDNNPFGPGAISQIFQDALRTLPLEHKMAEDSCKVFKEILCAQAGELFEDLNRQLIESGVLPVLKASDYFKPRAEASNADAKGASFAASETVSATATEVPMANAAGQGDMVGHVLPPDGTSQIDVGSWAAHAPQDWYGLMKGLGSLQQFVAQQAAQRQGGNTAAALHVAPPGDQGAMQNATPAAARFFTPEELLHALSRVDREARTGPAGARLDLKGKLAAALAEMAPSAESKALPGRERNILEIGGSLFDSVLSDKLVANTVKPWLKKLSIPMIKMAIKDDSLLFDESHLARRLINQIAELELYGEGEKVEMVRNKIDQVLDEIGNAEEVTPQLVLRMLKEVGALVHVQHKAYEENMRDVYAACEAEEEGSESGTSSADGSGPAKPVAGAQAVAAQEGDDENLREWMKQVRRLQPGNWLLLEQDSVSKRLRLAWVAKNRDRYAFVNLQGLREATLTQQELAQQLRDGSAMVLDDAGEHLVDRAQANMLQKMHHQLLHESSHDLLTGLVNRREFEKQLSAALAKARKSGVRSSICYLDLNQFSVVNTTFGYAGGDRMLVEVTELLKGALGGLGVLSRIGGDEFAILLEDCAIDEALAFMARQKEGFEAYRFAAGNKKLAISFSAGLVAMEPDSESVASLLQAAEASCRIARGKGTNYVQVFRRDEADVSRHLESIQWVSRIDEALDHDSLELRCQPIVSIAGKNILIDHFEVLLGVPDGKGNLISPVDFIMAAERYRRMASVDRWVVEHAFRWIADRRERVDDPGTLAINLSGASLNEEGLIDFVLQQAERTKVPMDRICFEITETAGITHLSDATEFILKLKETGCSFSLDDFGSGLSSYAYLKHLPVDYLKIDGAFVEKMDENPYDLAVVKSITEIGHFLGKKIIAERVENETVLKILREMGVDYAQGFFLGKPRRMRASGSF